MAVSRPFKEDRPALPLSTPLSSRRSMVWCPWLCARRECLKLLNTRDLPRSKPFVRVALPASLSARSFPFTPACPGQYTQFLYIIVNRVSQRLVLNIWHSAHPFTAMNRLAGVEQLLIQCCFASTETMRLIRDGSPGRPPRLSHSSWTLSQQFTCVWL